MAAFEKPVAELLALAGLKPNGPHPWDPQVRHSGFYARILREGPLGLGESYMEGWWDCDRLDQFFERVLTVELDRKMHRNLQLLLRALPALLFNPQRPSRAFRIGERHYNLGNDLFEAMLDRRMTYTCAYWKGAKNLDEAQEAKLDLVCRKLNLKAGQTVLDIGCGWGSFAKFAAERYGPRVVGITVSKEQLELGRKRSQGLPVELRLQDYRQVNEPFDHVVSLGMFEHVGYKNYQHFMMVVHRCLREEGLFLLQTFGNSRTVHGADPWFEKYIFPGGMIPSIRQVGQAVERLFVMEDWHNFGADYDRTLMAWHENFTKNWDKLSGRYDQIFYRMWRYYLLSLAGAFRARRIQLWQVVFSKRGVPGGYLSIR